MEESRITAGSREGDEMGTCGLEGAGVGAPPHGGAGPRLARGRGPRRRRRHVLERSESQGSRGEISVSDLFFL
jgi:hypothetical protein